LVDVYGKNKTNKQTKLRLKEILLVEKESYFNGLFKNLVFEPTLKFSS
jgi:hypothetical protein